eukprot:TRINITY_DN6616_c0_g2_i1.p1 TRINITY_DN6616_c0_g2~~TRINITY_DN6616_c0_g2_i1.p1  ORF type:complete len:652 (-),score=112.81 TRINITY_DN6616_c0_g2_i1:190-2145(-)
MADPFIAHLSDICDSAPIGICVERHVTIRIAEAKNLPKVSSAGYFTEVFTEDYKSAGRTLTKSKDTNPFWGEEMHLTLNEDEILLYVIVFKDSSIKESSKKKEKSKQTAEIGRSVLNLESIEQGENWYPVMHKGKKISDIRISISYDETTILPKDKYTKIVEILMDESTDFKIISLLNNSGSVVDTRDASDIAACVCTISEKCGKAPAIINKLLTKEIEDCQSKEVLFRGNSIVTKAVEFYMKLTSHAWLNVLKNIVQILDNSFPCEVREGKISPDAKLEENVKNLTDLFNYTTKIIFDSSSHCPPSLRVIFNYIKKTVEAKYKDEDEDAGYTGVTSFIFLRFFVSAIMTPKLFGLLDDYATGNSERAFKLVASSLQKLGNLQTFEAHEAHLDMLNPVIQKEMPNLKQFVDSVCRIPTEPEPVRTVPELVLYPGLGTKRNTLLGDWNIGLEAATARLLRLISKYSTILTKAPDKIIGKFLIEMEAVVDESKFLGNKFKSDQRRRRKEREEESTPTASPILLVKRVNSTSSSPVSSTSMFFSSPDSPSKRNSLPSAKFPRGLSIDKTTPGSNGSSGDSIHRHRSSSGHSYSSSSLEVSIVPMFPLYVGTPPFKKDEVPPHVWDYCQDLLLSLSRAKLCYEDVVDKLHKKTKK